ncbi:MAG TPA: hypothetical protein H9790_03980 [Candidatus Agathobaculum intestinipullorum]|nr:hypothetical protein [Candidatus Agathobaculum intestinipullorum]
MKKVYACLIGEWVCLNDDPDCVISDSKKTPYLWWEEGAPVYAPVTRNKDTEHSLYGLDYVNLYYKGKDYRINPIFIQIVTD